MTREEIIDGLEMYTVGRLKKNRVHITVEELQKFIDAIKTLEQEPVLDKIRAEIKALSPEPTAYDVVDGNPIKDAVWETLADVLQIIDKYKGESEDKR